MKRLEGVIVPVALPLAADESIDRAGLTRLLKFLEISGVDGLFANGSFGGFAFHPDSTQLAAVEAVAEYAGGRLPVLAGASDTSVARTLERIRAMAGAGVDAVVLLPPYYYVYGQPDLERYFLTLAEASPKPLVLYENPRLAHNTLAVQTIVRLAEHPNIVGLKISTADAFAWQELLAGTEAVRGQFSLICGAENLMNVALRLGFDGVTGGFHNFVPDWAVAMYRAARAGNHEEALRLQRKINRGYRVFEAAGGWRGGELALQWMGIARKMTVRPFDTSPPAAARQEILAILEGEGFARPYPSLL